MGPLVPDVITNELNLVVALLLGIAFGFILEQAGFSSSRKLTGLFYGTDFTVLRVFFTAGATAMTGVVLLAHAGLLDTSVIYVLPTFVPSAIVGGLIMGVGFVVGGFCPGTSFCAAAVGRIDGMVFVLGGLVGVVGFGEAFPRLQQFYMSGGRGDITVPAALGISPGLFALATIVIAVVAFAVTTRIERHINPASTTVGFSRWGNRLAAAALIGAGVIAVATPDYKSRLLAQAGDERTWKSAPIYRMTADELAFRILDRDPSLVLVDVRPAAAFGKASLPGSINVRTADMFGATWRDALGRTGTRKVFVADTEAEAMAAASLALRLGYDDVGVLQDGMAGFTHTILDAKAAPDAAADQVAMFRADAGVRIEKLIKERGAVKPVVKAAKKIVGGCGV